MVRTAIFTVTLSKPSTAQLATVNAVGRRCWDYLELRYRNTPGDKMRYTLANDNENWYNGVNVDLLRQRLTETKIWLANNVR